MKGNNTAEVKNTLEGIIVKGIAGFYYVKSGDKVYTCKARGIFKKRAFRPAVGDIAVIRPAEDGSESVITEIKERKNSFIRPFVANIDCFMIVTAAATPDPVFTVIDRFCVMAEKARTDIVICINKCDLAEDGNGTDASKAADNIRKLKEIYSPLYPVVCLDSIHGTGTDQLRELAAGKKAALAGASGVGKSTILNQLVPGAGAETGSISDKLQRGKNTTRHSELFFSGDLMIFDTPGFTSFDVLESSETELQHLFPEISSDAGSCRYSDCRHLTEPGCAVMAALENGEISSSRYASYRSMLEEIRKSRKY